MMVVSRAAAVALVAWCSAASLGAQAPPAPSRGSEAAPAQIEVFLSFTSEPSARSAVVLDTVFDRNAGKVRITFRHLLTDDDPAAELPHRAAIAAAAQGRFWEMARLIFANQPRVTRDDLIAMAAQLELDTARFVIDLDSPGADAVLAADRERAAALGVATVPTFVINGATIVGVRTARELDALLTKSPEVQ